MKPTPRDVRWLVDQLDDQKRRLQNLENRKPGLAYSSIEDGAIREYDKDGVLGSQTGKQPDGTHGNVVLNGPKPPTPSMPTATAIPGIVEVRWNGKFTGDAVSPLDFKHVAAYVVPVGEFLDHSKQAGVLTGELGDNVQVQVDAGVYNVYLVAWSKAGRFSDAAGPVPVLVPVAADVDAIQAALDDLGERYDGVITEAGNLGVRLDTAETDIAGAETRLDEAGTRLDTVFGQVSAVDGKATAASTAASSAQSKADTAKSAADQAAADALAASGVAAGKGKVLVQSAAPGVSDRNAVTLWIDTTGGANTPKRWTTGATWVAVTDKAATDAAAAAATAKSAADAAAAAALTAQQAAGTAQSTADSALTMAGTKARVYYSTSTPSGTASTNDIWRQIDATKNVIGEWYWASGWVKTLVSSQAISNLDVGKLTVGTGIITDLVAEHIAGRSARFLQLDVSQLVAVTGTMSEAVITKLFTDVVMSQKITTQMLAIGSFDNLVVDPDFTDTALRAQRIAASSATITTFGTSSDNARAHIIIPVSTGQLSFKMIATEPGRGAPVAPGATYRIRYQARAASGAAETRPAVTCYKADGTSSFAAADSGAYVTVGTSWQWVDYTWTAPDDAASAFFDVQRRANLTGILWARTPQVTRMNAGELVVDGSIKAAHADLVSFAANTGFIADLTARIVKSDMFVGNEFVGAIFTGAVIKSPGVGAGYQLAENGYTSRDADGNITVRLPADGSPAQFRGDIEARSLTATGKVSLQASENEIASGAELIIRGGVSAPVSPLSVGETYDTAQFPAKASNEGSTGLAYAGGLWWRAINTKSSHTGDRLEGINDAGQVTTAFPIAIDPLYGVTAIGSNLYVMGRGHADPAGAVHVYVYSQTGTFVRKWQYNEYGSGTYQPGIGIAGTEILIAQCGADKKLTWRTYNPTTGALTSQVTGNTFPGVDVAGAYRGNADFGTTAVVIADTAGGNLYFNTTGTWQSALGWRSPNGEPIQGIAWDGTRFRTLSLDQRLYSYSKITDTIGDTYDWWVTGTWAGPNGVETTMGPPARFVLKRRAGLRVTVSGLPVGVTGANIYLARKSTAPTRADLHKIGSATSLALKLDALPAAWASAALPPASNTFPDTAPAKVSTVNQNFKVDGQGAGQWGPLRFNADGTMTSSATPDWIPITSYKAGFGPQTFGFVPAYRVWPDKKVEWRGTVQGTGTGFGIRIFEIPTEARPAQAVNLVGGASTASSGLMRIEFGATTNGQDAQVNPPSGTNFTWICLDGLYYYRE